MLARYEPTVQATIVFLKLLHVKVNNSTVDETLQNHPDWPSLLCISDSLNKWHIPNAAGNTGKADIDRLPLPFMAYMPAAAAPLAVVKNITDTEVSYSTGGNRKYITEEKSEFLKKWNGVYLVAEANEQSGEPAYNKVKRKSFIQLSVPLALIFLLFIGSVYLFYTELHATAVAVVGAYFHYCIFLAGVLVTALLLWYEVDKNNPVLQKVCTGFAKANCNAILSGKQAKAFGNISWSETGFVYFSGGLLYLLFAGNSLVDKLTVLSWLGILVAPYTVFSIYYQWKIARQWCVLCLAVQFLLLTAVANAWLGNFLVYPLHFSFAAIISIAIFYLLPALGWASVRPWLLRLQQAKNTKREYLRIKFNGEVFDSLLKKQKSITAPVAGLGIDLGKITAQHTLIKVCNPYCGPCAKAHPKIEKLLETNGNLQVKIIFTAPDDDKNSMSQPVKHLMAITEKQDEQLTKKALDDWYLAEKKDYEIFAKKHPMNGELALQGAKLNAMDKWCREMNIVATPTFFLDGYQLPDAYSIGDLEYFLLG